MHLCDQAHALLVRTWSSDPMQRPLFSEMMPTLNDVLMPRAGGGGHHCAESDDGLKGL
jgi:hypothetical protein